MDSPVGNVTSDTSSNVEESWIQWFCGLTGNHFFCEVDKGFVEDSFNLFGLKQYVAKDYNKALDIILDRLTPEIEDEELKRSGSLLANDLNLTAVAFENPKIFKGFWRAEA